MTYHTADSTAFPQPAPGVGPGPGPLQVPADKLKTLLGIRRLDVVAEPGGPHGYHSCLLTSSPR